MPEISRYADYYVYLPYRCLWKRSVSRNS